MLEFKATEWFTRVGSGKIALVDKPPHLILTPFLGSVILIDGAPYRLTGVESQGSQYRNTKVGLVVTAVPAEPKVVSVVPTMSERLSALEGASITKTLRLQADYCAVEIAQLLVESRGKLLREHVANLSFIAEVQRQCEEHGFF